MWKCKKCDWTGNNPTIKTKTDGKITYILDVTCPECTSLHKLDFTGTESELDNFWSEYFGCEFTTTK